MFASRLLLRIASDQFASLCISCFSGLLLSCISRQQGTQLIWYSLRGLLLLMILVVSLDVATVRGVHLLYSHHNWYICSVNTFTQTHLNPFHASPMPHTGLQMS